MESKTENLTIGAKWKVQFEQLWSSTPKRLRKNKQQINRLRSKAKLIVSLFG